MTNQKSFIKNIWLAGWLGGLILFASSALMPTNGPAPGTAYHLDKIIHLLMFIFLTAIPLGTFSNRKWASLCAALMPVFGLTLEYIQKSISGREFSPEDIIANNVGVVLGVVCGILIRLRRHFRKQGSASS